MKPEDAEEFTQSIGQIVAGSWRQIALAKRLGVPKALGLTTEQWVRDRLGGYVKMSVAERREAVKKLTEDEHSTREIGDILGVSHVTVAGDVKNLTPQIDTVAALAADEKVRDAVNAQATKQARRAERIARIVAISNADAPLPKDRKYPVILADPPWRFEVYDRATGLDAAADAHYPTMTTDEIKALAIPAADDAVLFLWATVPMLMQAREVMEAWGFAYVSNLVWPKDRAGTGYWVRNKHEHLLIGRRGKIPAPPPSARPESIIDGPQREHSRKPDETYALIERAYPDLPKVELFARGTPRPGWAAWGNEVERSAPAAEPAPLAADRGAT